MAPHDSSSKNFKSMKYDSFISSQIIYESKQRAYCEVEIDFVAYVLANVSVIPANVVICGFGSFGALTLTLLIQFNSILDFDLK